MYIFWPEISSNHFMPFHLIILSGAGLKTNQDITGAILMIFVVMNGLIDGDLNWVGLGYMDSHSLLNLEGDMLFNGVGNMLHDGVGDDFLNGNRDFGLNWNSHWLVHGYLDWVRLGYTDKNRFRYVDLDRLVDGDRNMFVLGYLDGVLDVSVFADRDSLGVVSVAMETVVGLVTVALLLVLTAVAAVFDYHVVVLFASMAEFLTTVLENESFVVSITALVSKS